MSELLITECPGCHSRFRVTEGQLHLAQGQVRCGACLLVFDARAEAHRLERKQRSIKAARQNRRPSAPPAPAPSAADGAARPAARSTPPAAPAPRQPPPPEPTAGPAEHAPLPGDDLWPQGVIASIGHEEEDTRRDEEVSDTTDALIPRLYAEPILLEVSREQNDPYAATGWALASLVALLLLAGQYLWFERATLAHNPDLHPLYTLACDSIPCELGRDGYRSIVNQNLVVRPHPAFADALSVDIRLRNDAAFAQPYPALALTFTDLKGRPVAGRVFQPREYLPRERVGEPMQSMTPVQLQLEITDPGVRAVSYELKLRPAG